MQRPSGQDLDWLCTLQVTDQMCSFQWRSWLLTWANHPAKQCPLSNTWLAIWMELQMSAFFFEMQQNTRACLIIGRMTWKFVTMVWFPMSVLVHAWCLRCSAILHGQIANRLASLRVLAWSFWTVPHPGIDCPFQLRSRVVRSQQHDGWKHLPLQAMQILVRRWIRGEQSHGWAEVFLRLRICVDPCT